MGPKHIFQTIKQKPSKLNQSCRSTSNRPGNPEKSFSCLYFDKGSRINKNNKTSSLLLGDTDHVTLGNYLATLQLKHLEAIVLKHDSLRNKNQSFPDSSSLLLEDSVYFELGYADQASNSESLVTSEKPLFQSASIRLNPCSCWDGAIVWSNATTPCLSSALQGSPVSNPMRRLRQFSLTFYRASNDGSGCRVQRILCHARIDLARDLTQVALDQDYNNSLGGGDTDCLLDAMSNRSASVALKLKGVYFLLRRSLSGVEFTPEVRQSQRQRQPPFRMASSYDGRIFRQVVANSTGLIDLEAALARVRQRVHEAEARLDFHWRVDAMRALVDSLRRRGLGEIASQRAESEARLGQLRQDNQALLAEIALARKSISIATCLTYQSNASLADRRDDLAATLDQLANHRRAWLKQLMEIFPLSDNSISGVELATVKTLKASSRVSLTRLSARSDSVKIAAAGYGLVGQLLGLSAAVMDFPLRYAIYMRGSKSRIRDEITRDPSLKRDLPLYHKLGKDWSRFSHSVLLLNLNVYGLACNAGAPKTLPDFFNGATAAKNLRHLLEFLTGCDSSCVGGINLGAFPEVAGSSPNSMPSARSSATSVDRLLDFGDKNEEESDEGRDATTASLSAGMARSA